MEPTLVLTMGNPPAEIATDKLVWLYDVAFGTNFDMDLERGMESDEEYSVTDPEILDRMARTTASACAEVAQVYASGHAGNWVWMDSFVFRSVGGGELLNPDAHTPAIDSTRPK